MWLDTAECISVSSLEIGSEFDDEDDSTDFDPEDQDGSDQDEKSYGSYDPSSCSSSEESDAEDHPVRPTSSRKQRYSRQERLKQKQQQQQVQPPRLNLPLPAISKRGVSSPDLRQTTRPPTGPGKSHYMNTPYMNASDRLEPPSSHPLKKNNNSSRWNSSSSFVGAKKAGWDLLNDARIGMKKTTISSNCNCNSKDWDNNRITTRVLDVSIKHTPSSQSRRPPKAPASALKKTTINLTTVTVSINKKADSSPNLGAAAAAEQQRQRRRSNRRRRRNFKFNQGSEEDDTASNGTPPSQGPAFRRCTSDPSSLFNQCRWKDKFSNSPASALRRVRRSGDRHGRDDAAGPMGNSSSNTRWSSASSSDEDETPRLKQTSFRRCRSEPSYSLTKDMMKKTSNSKKEDRWMDRFSDHSRRSSGESGGGTGSNVRRPGHNTATKIPRMLLVPTATAQIPRTVLAPKVQLPPKIPRASAPNLMTSLSNRTGGGSSGSRGNARWGSTAASPSNTRSIVLQQQPSKSSLLTGVSAPSLLNLLNQRRSSGGTIATPTVAPPAAPSSSLLMTNRPGLQRTNSHMVLGGRNRKLTNASVPNLRNFRRTASVPQTRGSANAQWGAFQAPPSASRTNLLAGQQRSKPLSMTRNNNNPLLASGILGVGAGSLARPAATTTFEKGTQTDSCRMNKSKMTGASAPSLRNINLLQRAASVPQPGGLKNAQWGTTNTASSSISMLQQRPGLQRTDSRMGRTNKNNLLPGASAPNLMNLQATRSRPTAGSANNSNAQWNNTIRSDPTQRLAADGLSATSRLNPPSAFHARLTSGDGLSPSSLTTRPVVSRTTSHMVRGNNLGNASAPNLLNFRRASIPQTRGSANAQWGARDAVQGSMLSQLGSRLGGVTMSKQTSGSQRSGSRTPLPMSRDIHVSTPNLTRLNLGKGTSITAEGAANSTWEESTLLRAASHMRQGRMAGAKQRGISTPNLLNFSRSTASSVLPSDTGNAQWTSSLPTVAEPTASNLKRNTTAPVASLHSADSTRLSNLGNSNGLMRSITNPNPIPPTSRWDSASAFDLSSLHESTNVRVGERPKSPPNTSQLLFNHSLSSQRRNGASAPNLWATNRRYTSEGGRANADWNSKRSSGWTRNPSTCNNDMGVTLETLLDLVASNRCENRKLQMDQWSINPNPNMLPKRQKSKSKKKRKKKRRRSRHGKEDGTPSQLDGTDTADSIDAPPIPIRRTATDETIGTLEKEEVVDLVSEVTDFITSELEDQISSTSDSLDSVANAAVSLAALEITRFSRMALRKERSNSNLVDQGDHEHYLLKTIQEHPSYQSDDSVDMDPLSQHDDDTISYTKEHHRDNKMKAPVRSKSSRSEKEEFTEEMPGVPGSMTPQTKVGPMVQPQRRASADSIQDTLLGRFLDHGAASGGEEAFVSLEFAPTPIPRSTKANRLPQRKLSPDSTKSQLSQSAMVGESTLDNPSCCLLSCEADKDVAPMADCSNTEMSNVGPLSHTATDTEASSSMHAAIATEASPSMDGANAICEVSDMYSPVDVKKLCYEPLIQEKKSGVGCNSGAGLNQCSTSPSSASAKAGSLGAFKARLGLMAESEGSNKPSKVASQILGNLNRMNDRTTTSISKLSSSMLSSLKSGAGLMHNNNNNCGRPSSSFVSSSQLGYVVSNRSNGHRSPEMKKPSPFGNIINDVSKMIQLQQSNNEQNPQQQQQQEKMRLDEEEEQPRTTITSAGCPTSEKEEAACSCQ